MQESLAADAEIGREGQVRMMDSTRVSLISPLLGVPSRAALIVFISGVLPTPCDGARGKHTSSPPRVSDDFRILQIRCDAETLSLQMQEPIRLGNLTVPTGGPWRNQTRARAILEGFRLEGSGNLFADLLGGELGQVWGS